MEENRAILWVAKPMEVGMDLSPLAKATSLPPRFLALLVQRGLDSPEQINRYLYGGLKDLPDPSGLTDLDLAVERLAKAIAQGERIAVCGDYDVDGITGTALLSLALEAFGAQVDTYLPLRLVDGYGLSAENLRRAAAMGATVAVSVDCGVSSIEEAKLATKLGLDLIITDHHLPPDPLPEAYALVNPQRKGETFAGAELAGVGVAFMVLVGLRRALRPTLTEAVDLRQYLDLVALGTVADIAPLTGINRLLVKAGLKQLALGQRPGIKALVDVAQVTKITTGTIGFQLAPRLNAAGRLDDANVAVGLLRDSDADRCKKAATQLDRLNHQRQEIEQQTFEQAQAMLASAPEVPAIVLASAQWHSGVIGIVASRLVERYYRPVLLIALDETGKGKGSGRSVPGVDLYDAIAACATHLTNFGGHRMAAGFSLDASRMAAFKAAFIDAVDIRWPQEARTKTLEYDAELLPEEIAPPLFDLMQLCAPFGVGNPTPTFLLSAVEVADCRCLKKKHLKFSLCCEGQSFACIAFNQASSLPLLSSGPVDLLFSLECNQWKGRTTYQLQIKGIRAPKMHLPNK